MKSQTKMNIIFLLWFSTIFFLIVVLILRLWTPQLRMVLSLVVAPGGFVCILCAGAVIYQKTIRKITALLFEQCDTDQFLSAVYTEAPGKAPNYPWVMLAYEGLYAAGRYGEALAELHNLTRFKNSRTGASQQAAWYVNLAEVSIALGRIDDAWRALDECRNILENREMVWKSQHILNEAYRFETCRLNMALGIIDGAEAVLAERLNQAKNAYERVSASYNFALLYRLTGEDEKAREALEYVAAHGNRLHFAAIAREQLGMEVQPSIARLWKQEAAETPTA